MFYYYASRFVIIINIILFLRNRHPLRHLISAHSLGWGESIWLPDDGWMEDVVACSEICRQSRSLHVVHVSLVSQKSILCTKLFTEFKTTNLPLNSQIHIIKSGMKAEGLSQEEAVQKSVLPSHLKFRFYYLQFHGNSNYLRNLLSFFGFQH